MTEDEAKTKWCPFVSMGFEGRVAGGINRILSKDELTAPIGACVGSECMAWRWLHPAQPNRSSATMEAVPMIDHEGKPARGHCGLAGKP